MDLKKSAPVSVGAKGGVGVGAKGGVGVGVGAKGSDGDWKLAPIWYHP